MALSKIGAQSTIDALAMWEEMPVSGKGPLVIRWLRMLINLLFFHRNKAQDLAYAYYRLLRALQTGSTVTDEDLPSDPKVRAEQPRSVSLNELRDEFRALVPDVQLDDFDQEIPIEALEVLDEAYQLDDEQMWDIAARAFAGPGIGMYNKELNKLDQQESAEVNQASVKDIRDRIGSMVAREAGRLAQNAGRSNVSELVSRDKGAVGYARISKSGTPCGFCAMLISRQVLYKSKKAGMFDSDGEKYHTNCNCVAVPVFSQEEFDTSPIFAQNREFWALWNKEQRRQGLAWWNKYHRDIQYKAKRDRESRAA